MKLEIFVWTTIATFLASSYAQLCAKQSPGNCQAVMDCYGEIYGDDILCEFMIYDYNCNLIGNKDGPQAGDCITSQLPETVDVTWVQNTIDQDKVGINFWYAGGKYGRNVSPCTHGTDARFPVGDTYSRCAFPC
jgi:hypothetical protein